MIYEFNSTSKVYPLLPWVRIFSCLSLKQFSQVYDFLAFPFMPSEDMRQVARDFVVAAQTLRGDSASETIVYNLLSDILPGDTNKQRQEKLFLNIFSQLEKMGCGDAIYQWGKRTTDFQNPSKVRSLAAFSRLLRYWAILEYHNKSASHNFDQRLAEVQGLVNKWMSSYVEAQIEPLQPLKLPLESLEQTYNTIMNYEMRRFRFEQSLEDIKSASKIEWEESTFITGVVGGVWIRLEGTFRIDLQEWHELSNVLSPDELNLLEQWAQHHKTKYSWIEDLTIPLPDVSSF